MTKRKITYYLSWIIVALFITAFTGCDLPRDNPLDPKAYNYQITSNLPVLTVNSYHTWEWYPLGEAYYLDMKIEGSLVEEADSADVIFYDGFHQNLYKTSNMWFNFVDADTLPGKNLFNLVGTPLYGVLYFDEGNEIFTDTTRLIRVIEDRAEVIGPDGNTQVVQPIVFTWEPISMNIDFSLEFVLYFKQAELNLTVEIFRESGLPDTLTSYTLPQTLPPKEYTWIISVVDVYNNVSTSKEQNFYVPQ